MQEENWGHSIMLMPLNNTSPMKEYLKIGNNTVNIAYHESSDKDVKCLLMGEVHMYDCKNISLFCSASYLTDLESSWTIDPLDFKVNYDFLFFFLIFSYKKCLGNLKIKEGHIAKLVPHRIFSMAFHPAKYKTLVVAGDKWGNLGIWDVVRDHFLWILNEYIMTD